MPSPANSVNLEDYLRALFGLLREEETVRPRDLAERLNVGKGSAAAALRQLAAHGYIIHGHSAYVTLTPEGERAARRAVERHAVLTDFLGQVLGIDPAKADATARRLDQVIDDEVLSRLADFVRSLDPAQTKSAP